MTSEPAGTHPGAYQQLTELARTMWGSGDFARAGAEQVVVGELLAWAIDVHPGERVLDVAAGAGNAALAAARRGARVVASDFVPEVLDRYIGPTKTIFNGWDAAAHDELAAELTACFAPFNRATDGTLVAAAEYLQVIATRA
jgi:2-polyprenyl-3-methyl-5-hydroxy-6-metoxy-1,4-benzoquinol methylase